MYARHSSRDKGRRQIADSSMRVVHVGFGEDHIITVNKVTELRLKMRQ
jgi:hypothetical protein